MTLHKRLRRDWYYLADTVSTNFKGSSLKRRQKGVCILAGILYALLALLDSLFIPFILMSLLFTAVNMSYSIYCSMSEFPPKGTKEPK